MTWAVLWLGAAALMPDTYAQETALLHELTAVEAAERIRNREISSVELVEALLDRIDQHASLNAFISINRRAALAGARAADRAVRRGEALGPLTGVPLVVKDNINARGLATTAGTPALANFSPANNAPVVEQLVRAGAIVLGKTNMHELAVGITSNNAHFGAVGNAYQPSYFAGGSSGGSGTAIAARLAPAGLGTDTGGSVRIPAALNGIAGLRPTIGRYVQSGIVPISSTLDTPGPMARSVEDLVLLDNVITGYDQPIDRYELSELRVGVPRVPFWSDSDTEVLAVAEPLIARLEAAGATVIELQMDGFEALVAPAQFSIALYEINRDLARYLDEFDTGVSIADVKAQIASPDVRAILNPEGDTAVTADQYRAAMEVHRPALQAYYRGLFAEQQLDALIFPTTRLAARPIEESDVLTHNGREMPTFPAFVANTSPGPIAGIPGLSIPIGLTGKGLPVGIEVDGPPFSDRRLLAIGLAIEALVGRLPAPD